MRGFGMELGAPSSITHTHKSPVPERTCVPLPPLLGSSTHNLSDQALGQAFWIPDSKAPVGPGMVFGDSSDLVS